MSRPTATVPVPDLLTRARPIAVLLMAAFVCGSGNVANKTVLDELAPWANVFLRCLVAALVLWPFALGETRMPGTPLWVESILVPSALFAVAMLLQQHG